VGTWWFAWTSIYVCVCVWGCELDCEVVEGVIYKVLVDRTDHEMFKSATRLLAGGSPRIISSHWTHQGTAQACLGELRL